MKFYDVTRQTTTSGTGDTEAKQLAFRTVANQRTASIQGAYVSGRDATAAGVVVRIKTAATISTGGAAITPNKRDPDDPAAGTGVFDSTFTAGGTPSVRQHIGAAAQGGFGGWFAASPEQALTLKPNGGANGNAEFHDIAPSASMKYDLSVEFAEL